MKKLNKTEQMMIFAKRQGYTHVASVVKTVFSTSYYNVNSCDAVLEAGHWLGAPRSHVWNGRRIGVIDSSIDWGRTITRERLKYLFESQETVR